MDPKRWREIERLCQAALEMEPGKREAYLKNACAGDESLRKEVEALLANQSEAEAFMKDPAMEAAAKTLAREQENAMAKALIGRTIAHYRIVEKIGAGGMGEVFLADDTSLHRKVALKFLPPDLQKDAASHKRFIREAQSAAALNHPYICSVYEVGDFEGKDFIGMEYVDGQTLADRLTQGPLPWKEALRIALEVAEALEEAHEKKIIHRDLKPANIMLTRKGHAKVMDFGLAKHLIPPGEIEEQDESITALTRCGMTLGTLAYMSPEQLRGESIDARSDIFSFGIVFYEMLAGVHPFKRATGMDTASAILKDAPRPLGELRSDAPVYLLHIVKKMLAKCPRDRYQSVHEVQTDLKGLLEEPDQPAQEKRGRLKPVYWIAAAALVVIAGGILAFLRFVPRETVLPPARFVPVTASGGERPALSPDGHWIAYQWKGEGRDNWDIYVKELGGTGFNRLTTDPADDCWPAWSPDGRQIAFVRISGDRAMLHLISPLGGEERKLGEIGTGRRTRNGLSWSPDGRTIAFVDRKSPGDPTSIWSISVETLERKQLTTPDLSYSLGDDKPSFSPDALSLAFVRWPNYAKPALYVLQLSDRKTKLVTDRNSPWHICWTTDSREIVFSSYWETAENALWRVSMDGGEPRRVPARGDKVDQPTMSRNRLAYLNTAGNSDIWRMELTGKEAVKPPSKPLFSWSSDEIHPVISPDGNRIAFTSTCSGYNEVWVCNGNGTKPVQLTDMKAGSVGSPSWSPDGKLVAFDSLKSGNLDVYLVGAEGGPVRQITTDPADEGSPQWSRDGHWIYFKKIQGQSTALWRRPLEGGKAVQIIKRDVWTSHESTDGNLYFNSHRYQKGTMAIWRVPASGGTETLVTEALGVWFLWDVRDQGIYGVDYYARPLATICFYDFSSRRIRSLAPVHSDPSFEVREGLSVSPDGKWLVYDGGIFTSDIMMIDNFR